MNTAVIVYVLCALTSLGCAVLLLRAFARSRVRLLLWSGLCFALFTLTNILLIIDVQVLPDVDLSVARTLPSIIGIFLLVYGLAWEGE
jgi:hypothetical protein